MLLELLLPLLFIGAFGAITWSFSVTRQRERMLALLNPGSTVVGQRTVTYPRRFRWVCAVLSVLAYGGTKLSFGWSEAYSGAAAMLMLSLAAVGEELIAEARIGRMEQQLLDAIDIMVSTLRAGGSLPAALEAVRDEVGDPFQAEVNQIVGRIRVGEDPSDVIRWLGNRVPLESMRLFTHTLLVHWSAGGSLAGTLLLVGRTIRDRIEVSRRIRAQAVESQVSVVAVMGISYITGGLMYYSNPNALREFLQSTVGTAITVGAVGLQAVGIYWIWRMSQVRF
jgi:tight adherence protein B